jgi:hypothetical protein
MREERVCVRDRSLGEPVGKLFHCIVVMGAAMGAGCGSATEAGSHGPDASGVDTSKGDASPGGAGDGGTGDAADCTNAVSQSGPVNGCSNLGSCRGTREAPAHPFDCDHPQQLQCGSASTPTGCLCAGGAPLVPADCPNAAEFMCDDWTQPCGCTCVTGAPIDASQCCPTLDASAPDAADAAPSPAPPCDQTWSCHTYDPPTGCACRMIPPPIL